MNTTTINEFKIIGISVRTTNQNNQAAKDITALWNKFTEEGILDMIPNKVGNTIYSVYTDYEGDYTKPYTTILGCKVKNLNKIPKNMICKTIISEKYRKFTVKGNLTEGIVYKEWLKIWNKNINRKYSADFEVYGKKSQNPLNAEVEIFIAIK